MQEAEATMTREAPDDASFDVLQHGRAAADRYLNCRSPYEEFVEAMRRVLREALKRHGIKVASVDGRFKTLDSFNRKASQPNPSNPTKPKYIDPMVEIKDLAELRVITFFPKDVQRVKGIINGEFTVNERIDKSQMLKEEE